MVRAFPSLAIARDPEAPRTRGDCEDGPRPCPWVACRYHLAIAEIALNGDVRLVDEWDDGRPTCALDVADEGEHTQEEIAALMSVSQQRVDQLERRAKARAQRSRHG
jgi:hypothetical protein